MGSQQESLAGVAPQQVLPPFFTRRAACPYFSFTTSLISGVLAVSGMAGLLFRNLNDVARTHGLVARAALGVEEAQDLFERFGIGGVPKERTLAGDADEVFVAQFVEMVGESGIGDVEFLLDFADHKALGMRLQQELHDAQAGFGAHGREHIRVTGDLVGRELARHISIIAEIWDGVKWLLACGFWRTGNRLAGVTAPRASAVHGGNACLFLVRSKQQRGLSTTFGWRLTPLKMTDLWAVSACRACGGPLISAQAIPRPSGAWTGHPFSVISPVLVMAVLATGDREREHLLG